MHASWLPNALAVRVGGSAAHLSVSAQLADDRSRLRLIVVNNRTVGTTTSVTIDGWHATHVANVTTLAASSLDAANPPGQPDLISPVSELIPWRAASTYFPPLSVITIVLESAASAD